MEKKTFLQLSILVLIFGIIFTVYKNYKTNKNISNNNDPILEKEKPNLKKDSQNLIYNIEYIAESEDGTNYLITSEVGELNNENPEIILMKKVNAIIYLKNSPPINISSDFAKYDNINFNTKFYENVLITHHIHVITSNNLDLLFEDNLATISNNVLYKNLNTTMQADKIVMDLLTKESKIFMDNKSEKVKIVSIN
jgi:hypothetical protein